MQVLQLSRKEFEEQLENKTTAEAILENAGDIYNFLVKLFADEGATDSVLREWSFDWASKKLNIDYNAFYYKWAGNNDVQANEKSEQFNASYGLIAEIETLSTPVLMEIWDYLNADNIQEFQNIISTELERRVQVENE